VQGTWGRGGKLIQIFDSAFNAFTEIDYETSDGPCGGGAIILIVGTGSTTGTVLVTGGTGGAAQGAGKNGASGSDGVVYDFFL
jgi:hypothetical protein